MKIKVLLLSISLIMLQSILVWGQNEDPKYENDSSQDSVLFNFRINSDLLMKDYRNNEKSLSKLNDVLTNDLIVSHLDSVVILSSASPDGRSEYNYELAEKRGVAIKSYIKWKYSNIDPDIIHISFSVVDWIEIKKTLSADVNFPYKEQTLEAISNDVSPATIEWRLRLINNGKVWSYIVKNYLWRYTAATSVFYYLDIIDKPFTLDDNIEKVIAEIKSHTEKREVAIVPITPAIEEQQEVVEEVIKEDVVKDTTSYKIQLPIEYEYKPLFALKTNLLFDAVSALNLEIEIPIGRRFSIAAEGIFPWWLWEDKQHCLQVLSGNIEGKYWFGNRENRPVMTGWFAGLYAGGGLYDLEWDKKGYQGEFYIAAGLSGGFTHTINKSGTLRMEYSLGVGYLKTQYREYESRYSQVDNRWHLIRQQNGAYTWIGPTKAKVSLVWLLNRKVQKGGKR